MQTKVEPFPPYDLDDDLLAATRRDGLPRLRVYPFERTVVVLGRGSKASDEVHLDACRQEQIPLWRRHGGGCAVVLDPGNVIVSVTVPPPLLEGRGRVFDRLSQWMINALARLDIPGVSQQGTSDLVLDDRKISGSCLYRSRHILFYSATLLVSPNIEQMERLLAHPPREPPYRNGRAHRDFVGRLLDVGSPKTTSHFASCLQHQLRLPLLLQPNQEVS